MSTDKSPDPNTHKNLLKSTSIMSLGTLSSRVLGFIRDVIFAQLLGTAVSADAFFVAFRIPNLLRDILGEGAANAAVIPVFSEYAAKKERAELWHFFSVLVYVSLIVLSVVALLGVLLAPVLVRLIAPGFMEDAQKIELTVQLTRMMFPYLILIGLTALLTGVLFTFRSFVVPAFSPCLLNVALIASAIYASQRMEEPTYGLAVGVLVGGLAQLLVQIRPILKVGIKFKRPSSLSHAGVKKIGKLLVPRLFGTGVYQLNIFVDTICASWAAVVGVGGISALYYANRIILFPIGIFGIALASVLLPTLSEFNAKGNMEAFKESLVFSLRKIFLVMLPISVFLVLFSESLIRVLFERGEFNAYSTAITSGALFCYAIGLMSYGAMRIMVTTFHSLQDTKTPVKVAGICLVINVVLNLILMFPFKVAGIALASAVAATINFLTLWILLEKRLGRFSTGLRIFFAKLLTAVVVAGLVSEFAWQRLYSIPELFRLAAVGFIAACIFLVAAVLFKLINLSGIREFFQKNKN